VEQSAHGKARRAQQNTANSLHLETNQQLRRSHTRALQEACLMTVSASILRAWMAGQCPCTATASQATWRSF